jgi:hypothetical protein
MLTYSRDGMAGPLRAWQQLAKCIKQGSFSPDSSRSGRWADEVLEKAQSPQDLEAFNIKSPRVEKASLPAKLFEAAVELQGEPDAIEEEEAAGLAHRMHEAASNDAPELPDSSSDSSSAPSSDDSSNAEEASEALASRMVKDTPLGKQRKPKAPSKNSDGSIWKHVSLGTFHYGKAQPEGDSPRLACGRARTERYLPVTEESLDFPQCYDCFGQAAPEAS